MCNQLEDKAREKRRAVVMERDSETNASPGRGWGLGTKKYPGVIQINHPEE